MARLDRSRAAAKGAAQIVGLRSAASESYDLAGRRPAASLKICSRIALQRLVDAGLVFQRGAPPTAEYLFKHALVQDAARRLAVAPYAAAASCPVLPQPLEAGCSDRAVREPEVLGPPLLRGTAARSCGGLAGLAAWASERSNASANQEAISHLMAGLAQLAELPDTADRTKQELVP